MSHNKLIVIGNGSDAHSYKIRVRGKIYQGRYGDSNDNSVGTAVNTEQVNGKVWKWNVDNYYYYGEILSVEGNGDLTFHFVDGTFGDDDWLVATSLEGGRHDYAIGTPDGDIDPHRGSTEGGDADQGSASSENSDTPDHVGGYLWGKGSDGYILGDGTTIQYLSVEDGAVKFAPEPEKVVNADFRITLDRVKKCGTKCRKATMSVENIGRIDTHNVEVEVDIVTGGDVIWSDTAQVGTLQVGDEQQLSRKITVSWSEASKLKSNGQFTTKIHVRSDEKNKTIERTKSV